MICNILNSTFFIYNWYIYFWFYFWNFKIADKSASSWSFVECEPNDISGVIDTEPLVEKHEIYLKKIIELCKRRVADDPNNPIPIKELWCSVSQDFNDRSEFITAIKKLSETEKLMVVNKEYVMPVETVVRSAGPHIDLTLLREYGEEEFNEQHRAESSKCPIPESI